MTESSHQLEIEKSPRNSSSSSCLASTDGECGADEENKGKITESDKKCNSDICSGGPGAVSLSHDGLGCDGGLCGPVDTESQSLIRGQAGCLDGSDGSDCIAKTSCEKGSSDQGCEKEEEDSLAQDCSSDSTDPSCLGKGIVLLDFIW